MTTTEAAIERARHFNGSYNGDWQPYITSLADFKVPDMPFCLVPVGSFQMGDDEGYDSDRPAHPQTITQPYWISRYPVTNAQWALAVAAGIVEMPRELGDSLKWYHNPRRRHAPVVSVSWFMARDFAAWLGCRLPSELEWEYAARGVESWRYPWGEVADWDRLVWNKKRNPKPALVTSLPEEASWGGAAHLLGNIQEWTHSRYGRYPYTLANEQTTGNRTDVKRMVRSIWAGYTSRWSRDKIRSARRVMWLTPDNASDGTGFRLVRAADVD
ncbi:MAG: formylglycine-generating enzyme family protein [Armatimonadetes bacterium]|nr:formylglycine-generating enzyme family protein [Anaerolineae bacterium]